MIGNSASVDEIAKKLNGVVWGNPKTVVYELALPCDSKSTSLTYFEIDGTNKMNSSTEFAACIVPLGYQYCDDRTYIVINNGVYEILHILIEFLIEKKLYFKPIISNIGKNTVIAESAIIGNGCLIGSNVVIEDKVIIGNDCVIGSNVVIEHDVIIGSNVEIQSGAIIGSDSFEYAEDNGYKKIINVGTVVISDNVTIGANCTVNRGTIGNTVIGEGTKIDTLVQIGHEVRIGRDCKICSQCGLAGWAVIKDKVTLFGKVGVGNNVVIEEGATVLAMSGVSKRVKEMSIVSGIPAINNIDYLREKAIIRALRKRR